MVEIVTCAHKGRELPFTKGHQNYWDLAGQDFITTELCQVPVFTNKPDTGSRHMLPSVGSVPSQPWWGRTLSFHLATAQPPGLGRLKLTSVLTGHSWMLCLEQGDRTCHAEHLAHSDFRDHTANRVYYNHVQLKNICQVLTWPLRKIKIKKKKKQTKWSNREYQWDGY